MHVWFSLLQCLSHLVLQLFDQCYGVRQHNMLRALVVQSILLRVVGRGRWHKVSQLKQFVCFEKDKLSKTVVTDCTHLIYQ